MGVYDRQIALALQLIKAKGEACVWNTTVVPVPADPSKPWISGAPVDTPYPVNIVFLNQSSNPLAQLIAGSNFVASGKKGLMPAVPFKPQLSDTVTRTDGSVLALKSVDAIDPNGQIILWTLEFKS